MQELQIIFPFNTSLESALENEYKHLLLQIENLINTQDSIALEQAREMLIEKFDKLKLVLDFDKVYEPKTIIEKVENNLYRFNQYEVFEVRDYRFKIEKGDKDMLLLYSGGNISLGSPPTGYIENEYLYIRVSYHKNITEQEKITTIFEQIKKQKVIIEQCIADQNNFVISFINKKLPKLESFYNILITEKEKIIKLNDNLKNKLSEI